MKTNDSGFKENYNTFYKLRNCSGILNSHLNSNCHSPEKGNQCKKKLKNVVVKF